MRTGARLLAALVVLVGLASGLAHAAKETGVPLAIDLQADGVTAAKQGKPILILYSLPGCPHCEIIRRSHLVPMLKAGREMPVIVRQVDLNSNAKLKDFAGRNTTHGEYSQGQGIRFAPIVKLVGPDGKDLAEPLTGSMLPDFYAAYLDDAISAARARLKASS